MLTVSKLNEIFNQSMDRLHETIYDSVQSAIRKLCDSEVADQAAEMYMPLKDQDLWDHLVYSLNTLGVLSMAELRELCNLRHQWCELEEVWDQLLPQVEGEEIFKLAMSKLQNCPQERAWVKLWYVLNTCQS